MPDGSDGLTRAEVWHLLDVYQKQWSERFDRHSNALDRNTTAMTDGFKAIAARMDIHDAKDDAVERRVHDIEEREKNATVTVTKRNMIASGGVSLIVGPAAAAFFRWMTGK